MNKETHHAAPATAQLRCERIVTMASCGRWAATARGRVQSMPRDNQHSTLVKYHFREHVDVASITSGIDRAGRRWMGSPPEGKTSLHCGISLQQPSSTAAGSTLTWRPSLWV